MKESHAGCTIASMGTDKTRAMTAKAKQTSKAKAGSRG